MKCVLIAVNTIYHYNKFYLFFTLNYYTFIK